MSDSGIDSVDNLISLLEQLNIPYEPCDDYTGSPDYVGNGFNITFEGDKMGLLVAIQKEGRIGRKSLSPQNLGLADYKTYNALELSHKMKNQLVDHPHSILLFSLMDHVLYDLPIYNLENVSRTDVNRILSDFGEVLAAIHSLRKGHEIYFPSGANHSVADYYQDGEPVSVKGRGTGGKVNLTRYRNDIDASTVCGAFLMSLATHNKDDFLLYSTILCEEIKILMNQFIPGSHDFDSVVEHINNISYDDFYGFIENRPDIFGNYGIPRKKDEAKLLWSCGRTEPFYFTINTLLNKLWGEHPYTIKELTKRVNHFLKGPRFMTVNIIDNKLYFIETRFEAINKWKTCYWGRATAPFHNWIGIEPAKGIRV